MDSAPRSLETLVAKAPAGPVVVLTGAGISAESGIPTFRGPEGFWTVGSREYAPQEIATRLFFQDHPEEVWAWYLYRRNLCAAAEPNAAHHALVELEESLQDRFALVTQNVDGLHRRAGSSPERTLEIHGNLHWMRCASSCGPDLWPVPLSFQPCGRSDRLGAREREALRCQRCGGWARPHVLWFDEIYDETLYRRALETARRAAFLLVIGTSGATSLPLRMGEIAADRRIPILDLNLEPNPFAAWAAEHGLHLPAAAAASLPGLVQRLLATLPPGPPRQPRT